MFTLCRHQILPCSVGYCALSCFSWRSVSSPGVGPELWLHSPSHRVGRELIDFPLGARRAPVNTQSPGGYIGSERPNGRTADTWPEKAKGVGEGVGVGGGHRRKLGSEHSQLPSGPCNPAEPHSAAVLAQSRGDISGEEVTVRQREGKGRVG